MQSNATLRVSRWNDHSLLTCVDQQYGNLCLGMHWIEGKANLPDFGTDSPTTTDFAGFASGAILRALSVNNEVFLCNGYDVAKILTGLTLREAGADAAAAPTLAVSGAATTLTGSYTAVYTYYDSRSGFETSPVATAPTLLVLAAQALSVSVVASSNTRFDKIRIYRNANGVPGTYQLDTEVSNATQSVVLSKSDSNLGATVSYGNYRPPITKYVAKTASRIWWAGALPYREGTCTVTNGSRIVTFTEAPPPNLYTRNVESPFHFNIAGGPRYGVVAPNADTGPGQILLAVAYQEATTSGQNFVISGPPNRLYFADLDSSGFLKSESWLPSNYYNVGVPANSSAGEFPDEITGLLEYGNRLYIFCRYSIWYFDPQIGIVKRTAARMGTLSDRSIVRNKENQLVYMGSDMQIYAFNGYSSIVISKKVSNRFMKKDRYGTNLMDFAHAYYDDKEGLINWYRPTSAATLAAMRYLIDTYDDLGGHWLERSMPRVSATVLIRDVTRMLRVGVDTLGLVQQLDDYETSDTFGDDVFPDSTPAVLTSAAGEISPGSNSQGKVAIVYNSTTVKGAKLIVGTQSSSATTENLLESVTVAALDSYLIGGHHAYYEVGWTDLGDPRINKVLHFISGTFLKVSPGFMLFSVYVDESATATETFLLTCRDERQFKIDIMARGRQFKIRIDLACEGVGFAIRDMMLHAQPVGDAD